LKRLIRNKETGHFLTPDGSWSKGVSSAWDFPDTPTAILEKRRLGLGNVELVLVMGDKPGVYDITLPL